MEKYDKDVEAKQKDLDVLKASKAKDLERLQELTKLVSVTHTTAMDSAPCIGQSYKCLGDVRSF